MLKYYGIMFKGCVCRVCVWGGEWGDEGGGGCPGQRVGGLWVGG